MIDFGRHLTEIADRITVALDQLIPPAQGPERDLMRAMRYAALADGKRIRPFYVIETGRMFGAPDRSLLRAAAALECVHCYSLIHDDLPCMDDSDFRRGQPTVHKAFDETIAVLSGDALLTLAFKILADPETHPDPDIRLKLVECLATSAGAQGMVGGQMIDMLDQNVPRDLNTITRMHRLKTGALVSCSVKVAGIIGKIDNVEQNALNGFAHDLGLAYQISDDLLDATGDERKAGKPLRADQQAGKANFVTLLGIGQARERVHLLAAQAKQHLAIFCERAEILVQSVDFILDGKRNTPPSNKTGKPD